MSSSFPSISGRDRVHCFEQAQAEVNRLDFAGKGTTHVEAYRQFQRRNAFGLDRNMRIYRIFQEHYYQTDVADGCLTLPRATANVWNDPLENPLASVIVTDPQTGMPVHLGSTVSDFYALCWTQRALPTAKDWASFSHGMPVIRIGTTVGKLLDRVMSTSDSAYMHRSWLVDVDYMEPHLIQQMTTPDEVLGRMESTGSMLALSAAVVRTAFSVEDEVRFLFDNGIHPAWNAVTTSLSPDLVRLPFDWSGFVDETIRYP
ncbi:hypothetical protein [Cupriavidus basilensis]|uniref:Uncharacterized protein n=1 Tax=Cupriavidus basilensis TaxID=68895 RepID=A0A643FXK8_9BURK|nr:hypothetical protein [Cupriavidus basilensis]QOT76550.1 hypothetical protein F7R26_000040 [Cupriavidus basilensis]